jgi:hypothetical protein
MNVDQSDKIQIDRQVRDGAGADDLRGGESMVHRRLADRRNPSSEFDASRR